MALSNFLIHINLHTLSNVSLHGLQSLFHNLVDLTDPIYQNIKLYKASMPIFDTFDIEAYITKTILSMLSELLDNLKFTKTTGLEDSYEPYKAAYRSMLSHSSANKNIKPLYTNGHFCYVYKFGLIINGLGIVRDISFYK